jgi:hypothetical protein
MAKVTLIFVRDRLCLSFIDLSRCFLCAVVSYSGHDSRLNGISFTHSRYGSDSCGGAGGSTRPAGSSSSGAAGKPPRLLPQQKVPQYQLLSCSADGTARMWRGGVTDGSVITFSHVKHSTGDASRVASTLNKTGGGGSAVLSKRPTGFAGTQAYLAPTTVICLSDLTVIALLLTLRCVRWQAEQWCGCHDVRGEHCRRRGHWKRVSQSALRGRGQLRGILLHGQICGAGELVLRCDHAFGGVITDVARVVVAACRR